MTVPFPDGILNALVRQRRHRKASVCDTKTAFFVSKQAGRRLDGAALRLGICEVPRTF